LSVRWLTKKIQGHSKKLCKNSLKPVAGKTSNDLLRMTAYTGGTIKNLIGGRDPASAIETPSAANP